MSDIERRALDAADDYDAAREARVFHCLRGAARSDGPLFDRARDARVAHDPDDEADRRRDREEDGHGP